MPRFFSTAVVLIVIGLSLVGCGGTRVALPVSMNQAVGGVSQSGVFNETDRIRWEMSEGSRQRLLVEHRDPEALIKQERARSVLAFTRLGAQTSEVLIRSDNVGYLVTTRDKQREQEIASGLRDWAEEMANGSVNQ